MRCAERALVLVVLTHSGVSSCRHLQNHYGIEFPVFQKTDVAGDNAHPVFQTMKDTYGGRDVNDNFEKFLVVDGHVVKRYPGNVQPNDMREDIEAALGDEPVKKSLRNQIHSATTHDGNPSPAELEPFNKLNNPSKEELLDEDPSGGRGAFGEDLDKPYGGEEDEHTYLEEELKRAHKENEKDFAAGKAAGTMTDAEIEKHRAAMKVQWRTLMDEKHENDRKRKEEDKALAAEVQAEQEAAMMEVSEAEL